MFLKDRAYKSGSTWALWRWTEVDSQYIVRLHLVKTPWFAVCLHWIKKPDAEPFLHDHPVSFLSIILRGEYTEQRRVPCWCGFSHTKHEARRWFNFIRATRQDRHRIISVAPGTLTLALMGPKTQEWGFHTPGGWVWWKDYYKAQMSMSSFAFEKWTQIRGAPPTPEGPVP
jgi:hypothetical protein